MQYTLGFSKLRADAPRLAATNDIHSKCIDRDTNRANYHMSYFFVSPYPWRKVSSLLSAIRLLTCQYGLYAVGWNRETRCFQG